MKELKVDAIDSNSSEFVSLLKLNPQLSSCEYSCGGYKINRKFVQFIAEESHIEKFELDVCYRKKPNIKQIHFKNVKRFVYLGDGEHFPFTFDQLQMLKLDVHNIQIDDIINQNGKLTKLSVCMTKNIPGFLSEELAKISALKINIWEWWDKKKNTKKYVDALAEFINKKSSASNIKLSGEFFYSTFDKDNIDESKWTLEMEIGKYELQLIRKFTYNKN